MFAFVVGMSLGVIPIGWYNLVRFESVFSTGKVQYALKSGQPFFGNPLLGFLTLLGSPGKSVLCYSPPLVLAVFGFGNLRRLQPALARGLVVLTVSLMVFISCIAFCGGDWCWGPRYLLPLIPLWSLALPFARTRTSRIWPLAVVVGLGLGVQLLAVSVEHQRFFFSRALPDFFWATNPSFYLRHSALFTRISEARSVYGDEHQPTGNFIPSPHPKSVTFAIFGNAPRRESPAWMRGFDVFSMPRPWPLWMARIGEARTPVDPVLWSRFLLSMAAVGALLVSLGAGL